MQNVSAILGLTALAASAAFAQFDTASVLGTVRDQSGAVIRDSKVTLQNVDTGVANSTLTDQNGDYTFFNVHVGRYRLKAEAVGINSASASAFPGTANAKQRLDF